MLQGKRQPTSKHRHSRRLAFLLTAGPAWAEPPTVLADTAPVHSLVAMVLNDIGSLSLMVLQGTSPHDAGLTPSEARLLTDADLVIWTGPAFLPWVEGALASLAPDTPALALLETEGWSPLPARGAVRLHEDGEHEDHQGEEGAHEEYDHDHEATARGGMDPHAWLNPAVAAAWLPTIAEALAAKDPENADTCRANAEAAAGRLTAMRGDLIPALGEADSWSGFP